MCFMSKKMSYNLYTVFFDSYSNVMGNCTHGKNQLLSRKSYEQYPADLGQFEANEPNKK